jgi:hypothetical protein
MHGEDGAAVGALKGGLRGAAVGAGASALGRGYSDTRLLNPTLSATQAVGATAKRIGEGVKRFGQRQLHGFTGAYADKPGQIGLRSTQEAKNRIDLLMKRKADLASRGELTDKTREAIASKIRELREWGREGDQALKAGITNLPGIVKGLATKPGQTVKAMGREITGGAGVLGGGALAVGAPVAIAVPDLARGDESASGGRTMRQKLVNLGSNVAGGAAVAGLPLVPQIAGGVAIDELANRTLGRRRGKSAPYLSDSTRVLGGE